MNCPTRSKFENYLQGNLTEAEFVEFNGHLSTCANCESILTEMENAEEFRIDAACEWDDSQNKTLLSRLAQVRNVVEERELTPDVPAGINGFDFVREIGRGGMGVVFEAVDLATGRHVALKLINPAAQVRTEEIEKRFEAEISAAAKIEHDHVVRVYGAGRDQGHRYCAMQLVSGPTLGSLAKSGMSPQTAASYIKQAAEGIAAAHDLQVLHRDVKPQNILIDQGNDRALVSDFGLAKLLDRSDADTQLTKANAVFGTVDFISPEQLRDSSVVGPAADIYSLGATLYYGLTGRPPFSGKELASQMRLVLEEEPVAVRKLNPEVAPDLAVICHKCLEKDAVDRYKTASELADDLGRYLSGLSILAKPATRSQKAWKWCRRNKLSAALAGGIALLVFGGLVASTISYANTLQLNANLRKANSALAVSLENEKKATLEAQEAFVEAMETTRLFSKTVIDSPQLMGTQDGVGELRQKLLETAQVQFQKLSELNPAPKLELAIVQSLLQSSRNLVQLGRKDEAVETLDLAESRLGSLRELAPEDMGVRYYLGELFNQRGSLSASTSEYGKTKEEIGKAWEIGLGLVEEWPDDLRFRLLQLTAGKMLSLKFTNPTTPETIAILDRCKSNARWIVEKISDDSGELSTAAEFIAAKNYLAQFYRDLGMASVRYKVGNVRDSWKQAIFLMESIPQEQLSPASRYMLYGMYLNYSTTIKGDFPDLSLEYRIKAVDGLADLITRNPEVPGYKVTYVKAVCNLARALISRPDFEQKKERCRTFISEAKTMLGEIAEGGEDAKMVDDLHLAVCDTQAIYEYVAGDIDASFKHLLAKKEVALRQYERNPTFWRNLEKIGKSYEQLASVNLALGRYPEMWNNLVEGTKYYEELGGHLWANYRNLAASKVNEAAGNLLIGLLSTNGATPQSDQATLPDEQGKAQK